MFAAFHLPALPLTCLLARAQVDPSRPSALLSGSNHEKSSLLQLNQPALLAGITPGMSTIRGLARCPDLTLYEPDPAAESSAQAEALLLIDSLTPDYERTRPDTFLLDLSTLLISSREDWLALSLEQAHDQLGLPLQLALADTPDLAHLASLSPQTSSTLTYSPRSNITLQPEAPSPTILTLDELLHCQAFPLPESGILNLWGLKTLHDLAALPRQGLAERLGPDLARLHDILTGKHHRQLRLHRPRQHFQASHHFEPPVEGLDPVLFIARRLFQTLCQRLAGHQRAAETIHLALSFDNGAAHSRSLTQSEPTLDPDILLRSLHTHLDSFTAPAPLTEFHLKLTPTLPRHAQHQLFQRGLKDPHQFADTLKRLNTLIGPDQLGIPLPGDSHRPDHFSLHPLTPDLQKLPESPTIAPRSRLPLKRQRPPIPLNVASEKRGRHLHPLALLNGPYQGTVQESRGPFPLSGSWWESPWQLSEWDVALPKNLLLQLTFTPPHDWHLTGIYG